MACDVKSASDFMRRHLDTLTPDTKVINAVALLLKDNISGAPVIDANGMYIGVFSEKCSMNALTTVVELAAELGMHVPAVNEFMVTSLFTLTPHVDVFDAIDQLLAKHISGAPVLDESGNFLGIFSEKTAMQVLVSAAYDQLPGTKLGAYMNTDPRRVIGDQQSLIEVAHKFQQTPYRRLPVLINNKLAGQVSRRDVIRFEYQLSRQVVEKSSHYGSDSRLRQTNCSENIERFVDQNARTISASEDLLSIAQIFLNTPYRRLPIVEDGRLLGQISRRDLLSAAAALLHSKPERRKAGTLYLSPLIDGAPHSLN